jgi:F-type H+-transporting ATPase subunit delta
MADNDFQVESMGEVYAQALINEAQKQNALDEVAEDVRGIGELLDGNKTFFNFTQALGSSEEDKAAQLEKIFSGRVHPLTLNAIKSMARRDRLMFLKGLPTAFAAIRRKMTGHVDVEIVAASEIRPEVLQRISQTLTSLSKDGSKMADITVRIDPGLIGGMTVRVGDTLIDGSVALQLNKMKDQLKRGSRLNADTVVA